MIIEHPKIKEKQQEIEALKQILTEEVYAYDHLAHITCRNLQTLYMTKIGDLDYSLYQKECEYRRLKRRLELMRAALARRETISEEQLEKTLDKEYASYQAKLQEKQEQMQEALYRISCPALKPEDAEDLRKLYRKLVRRLHPDVNPDGTENDLKLFQQAVEAYRNGDLSAMRILSVLADTGGKASQNDSPAVLEAERERLNACLETVRAKAEKVRNSFPYVLRDMLEDPAGIEEYRHSLKIRIEQYDVAIRELQTTVDELHRRMLS